jgi:DNA-binding PadR family transcriptional regulator
MLFLNAAAGPQKATSATSAYLYRLGAEAGLFMAHPPIPGRRRRSYRLTLAGLAVLDDWSQANPSFRPFFEAFVPKKARNEIALMAMDIALGQVPACIKNDLQAIDDYAKKLRERLQREEERRAASIVGQKMSEWWSGIKTNAVSWPRFKPQTPPDDLTNDQLDVNRYLAMRKAYLGGK